MRLFSYFVSKPVSAIVINALIVVFGLLSLKHINIREYPEVTIPKVWIMVSYPNASAQLIEHKITYPAEKILNGINGISEITSKSIEGYSFIELDFKDTADYHKTIQEIREKVTTLDNELPKEASAYMNEGDKDDRAFYYLSLTHPTMSLTKIVEYANTHIRKILSSLNGVAKVDVWGPQYLINIELLRSKLFLYKINPDEVVDKINKYKSNLSAGKLNDINIDIDLLNKTPPNFSDIMVNSNGIKLSDIATVDFKVDYNFKTKLNDQQVILIGISNTLSSNPIEVANLIGEKIESLQLNDGYQLKLVVDKSDKIRSSLKNLQFSLLESVIFIIAIVLVFLRDLKAGLIILITIPICLIGSIFILNIMGYSINTLTLLAMVLAVGLIVDDAIIVIENIFSHRARGKSLKFAISDACNEIGFALIAMTLTLSSVFIPIIFIKGGIGKLFIEFAMILSSTVIISGITALTLLPAICMQLNVSSKIERTFFTRIENFYKYILIKTIKKTKLAVLVFIVIIISVLFVYRTTPSEFAPSQEGNTISVYIAKAKDLTNKKFQSLVEIANQHINKINELDKRVLITHKDGVQIMLLLNEHRKRSTNKIIEELKLNFSSIPTLNIDVSSDQESIPILEANYNGVSKLIVKTIGDRHTLKDALKEIKSKLREIDIVESVKYDLNTSTIDYSLKLKDKALNHFPKSPEALTNILKISLDKVKPYTFVNNGVLCDIIVNSDFKPQSLDEIYLFNNQDVLSFSSIASLDLKETSNSFEHHNGLSSRDIYVTFKGDVKESQIVDRMTDFIKNYKSDSILIEFDQTILKSMDIQSQMKFLVILSIIFIYAILAIQFESFIDPLIIIFSIPFAILGALILLKLNNLTINIYSQIGIITLIGLISKHGIMIVEFANQRALKFSRLDAVVEAASIRLRPILMTTIAMVLSAIPLIISQKLGHEVNQVIGWVLIGGLSIGTLLTIFFIPVIYVVINKINCKISSKSSF